MYKRQGQVVRATIVPVKGYVPTEESVKIVQEYVKTHTPVSYTHLDVYKRQPDFQPIL